MGVGTDSRITLAQSARPVNWTCGPRDQLFEALETATAGQLAPLTLVISTQSPTDSDLLSILIDDALTGADPRVVCSLYTASADADPFALETIKAANPSMGAQHGRRCETDAGERSAYKNLVCNMRVEASAPFIMPTRWNACRGMPMDLRGRDVFAGLDLSAVSDLTALVLVGCDVVTGLWHCQPSFWLPAEGPPRATENGAKNAAPAASTA